ncbi:hypothetical protein AMK27_06065 [Streptomyces sp. CB02009]|uniref:hypothetical protein n=1 Tax=Streptomyces sp. CB02009 TaxID=1703938 RepID=UPI00093FD419|nr:hypothetical protein [Streptomyces sp. CB02009]OKJ65336.1 hypothetical protein AMK27_06065 [Streptomyces sp. CB02009]
MPVEYTTEGPVLALRLRADLDVTARAAAALRVERLVLAHRPGGVRLHLAAGYATGASLSVLARVRRLCEGLDIPLVVTGGPWAARTPFAITVTQAVGA